MMFYLTLMYVIDSAVLFRYVAASGVACCQYVLQVDVVDQTSGWTADRYTNLLV